MYYNFPEGIGQCLTNFLKDFQNLILEADSNLKIKKDKLNMAKNTEFKTNVMRMLDKHKINYKYYTYIDTEAVSGTEVAEVLGQNPAQVFKTLVTVGKTGNYYVFVIPVEKELDLKKAAHCVGEKSVEMLKLKDLLPTTGYIHGGCSPIGMKKFFKTTFDSSAKDFDTIVFSAGKIGYQVELGLEELKSAIQFQLEDITM